MKTIGIIAEFNPFHNGHKYLIDRAKRITKADNVVIICSGNYVQRGTPAIIDKFVRTQMAILNGADAVFELPVFYSTASAELFARAAIKFLTDLNCIDYLCFGCESDNLKSLPAIASILHDEPEEYKTYLNDFIKTGISFPKARIHALNKYCESKDFLNEQQITLIMSQPNNILAIEYLKAIIHFNSTIKPVAIKRLGAGYSSFDIDTDYASATGIRKQLLSNSNIASLVPGNCTHIFRNSSYITIDDFAPLLGYKLLSQQGFDSFWGISKDLSNRINNYKYTFTDINSFISDIQSKNFTYSGISRALLHVLLDIKGADMQNFINKGYSNYARLLGYNSDSNILSIIKAKSKLDIVSKLSTYYKNCDSTSRKMLDLNIYADNLYRMVYMNKYKKQIPTEFEHQIVIK